MVEVVVMVVVEVVVVAVVVLVVVAVVIANSTTKGLSCSEQHSFAINHSATARIINGVRSGLHPRAVDATRCGDRHAS